MMIFRRLIKIKASAGKAEKKESKIGIFCTEKDFFHKRSGHAQR